MTCIVLCPLRRECPTWCLLCEPLLDRLLPRGLGQPGLGRERPFHTETLKRSLLAHAEGFTHLAPRMRLQGAQHCFALPLSDLGPQFRDGGERGEGIECDELAEVGIQSLGRIWSSHVVKIP